jgi:hemoglobin
MEPSSAPATNHPWGNADTPFAEIGGLEEVRLLVEEFYDIIQNESPSLREMLPHNISGSRLKLVEFMSGWLGGPQLYQNKRGHPRLRMRHFPFSIGDEEAAEWMRCMIKAMDERDLPEQLTAFLTDRLHETALHLRNQPV